MLKKIFSHILHGLVGILIAIVVASIFGIAIMFLWNWIIPELFGIPEITYLQAWGLIIISRILFGSFRHYSHGYIEHVKEHHDLWKDRFIGKYKNYDKYDNINDGDVES